MREGSAAILLLFLECNQNSSSIKFVFSLGLLNVPALHSKYFHNRKLAGIFNYTLLIFLSNDV